MEFVEFFLEAHTGAPQKTIPEICSYTEKGHFSKALSDTLISEFV